MPTLFRLIAVVGLLWAAGWGVLFAMANWVQPEQRTIVQAVALPQASDIQTGRSVADVLDRQARSLVRHRRTAPAR